MIIGPGTAQNCLIGFVPARNPRHLTDNRKLAHALRQIQLVGTEDTLRYIAV